nr:Asp23/Gls24 family envelope stress response protein [Amycolatopsis granulosa]
MVHVEWIVEDAVVAAVAAHAARSVPGVARLEPGVAGLVRGWGRARWQQVKGLTPAPADGVTVRRAGDEFEVCVGIATRAGTQVAAVALAVQHEVRAALIRDTGVVPGQVSVTVLDVEPEAR